MSCKEALRCEHEVSYPRWFKFIWCNDCMVVKFDSLQSGIVVIADKDNNRTVGEHSDMFIPHTDKEYWEEVTDQYKNKMPTCEHGMPFDSECEKCQKEVQLKQNETFKQCTEWNDKNEFEGNVDQILNYIEDMLIEKNKSYGNSALNPLRVFSKVDAVEQLKVRIDDKLSRIARGNEFIGDDTVNDLIGYLVLYKIAIKGDNVEK